MYEFDITLCDSGSQEMIFTCPRNWIADKIVSLNDGKKCHLFIKPFNDFKDSKKFSSLKIEVTRGESIKAQPLVKIATNQGKCF